RSRNAPGRHNRRRSSNQLCRSTQVLRDGCQRELELRAAGTAKAQTAEPENALQVCEQHLDLLAIAARLLERLIPILGMADSLGFPNQLQNDSTWQTEGRLPWGKPLR